MPKHSTPNGKPANGGRYQVYPDPVLTARLEKYWQSLGHGKLSMSAVICMLLKERLDDIARMNTTIK